MAWAFLAAAVITGVGAYLTGWPAWSAYQKRASVDQNAERYNAWRGRGTPGGADGREGPTGGERRRFWLAGLLAGAALALLIAFFASA